MSGQNTYMLLDNWSKPLAKGILRSAPDAEVLQIEVLDGQVDLVAAHEYLQIVQMENNNRPMKCQLLRSRYDNVMLKPMEVLDPSLRENFRIPVCFDSYRYPADGTLRGRTAIQSIDLSCGGIAFYSAQGLAVGDIIEVVIPITEQPLILNCKILRVNELKTGIAMYAAKFENLCHDEEILVRRAVFSTQIQNDKS